MISFIVDCLLFVVLAYVCECVCVCAKECVNDEKNEYKLSIIDHEIDNI